MKFLVFNIVIVAALGYLFVEDGLFAANYSHPAAAAEPALTDLSHDRSNSPAQPAQQHAAPVAPRAAATPAAPMTAPPRTVAKVPVNEVPTPLPERTPSAPPQMLASDGSEGIIAAYDGAVQNNTAQTAELMTPRERRMELSRLAREMDLLAIEKLSQ